MMDSPEGRALVGQPWMLGRQGLLLIALITAIAATFRAVDITFLACALLLVALVARGWARVAFARLNYRRQASHLRAFCGDQLVLASTLANPRPLPLPWLEVWEQLPADLDPEGPTERSYVDPKRVWVNRGLALWPYQRVRWRRRLTCRHRGVFRLGEIRLRAGDPFGFVEREQVLADDLQVLVYPRVVPLRTLALPLHHPSLDVVSAASPVADPTRTATVRDYRPDDARRMIHWPTSARRGSLQVRVLEPATSLHVSLMVDVRGFTFGAFRGELLELSLSALASIAVFLQSRGAPIALLANTRPALVVPPAASVPHLQHLLERLARLEPDAGGSLLPRALEDLPRGNSVVLATSEVAPDLERGIGDLEAAGVSVLLVLAVNHETAGRRRPGTLLITPGCDVAARLEGRG